MLGLNKKWFLHAYCDKQLCCCYYSLVFINHYLVSESTTKPEPQAGTPVLQTGAAQLRFMKPGEGILLRSASRDLCADARSGRSAGHHALPAWASSEAVRDTCSLGDQEAVRNAGVSAAGITCQDKAQEKLACVRVPE